MSACGPVCRSCAYAGFVPDDFVIARNPDPDSRLPYLVRIPLGPQGIVLKARETWPRTAKVYCHRAEDWPADAEVIERVGTRSCVRRGAAIDLVLDRGRENRSQLVLTHVRGREAIFWQTARTAKQARPGVRAPSARAGGHADVEIVIDVHERHAWRFTEAQVSTVRRPLAAGDYAIERDGVVVAAVERKSLADLVSTLTTGKMRYLLAELATLPRAAVVVEDRYSRVFTLTRVRPAVVADALAECQARFPSVPIVFTDTRSLAQQWTYRFLVACAAEQDADTLALDRLDGLVTAGPVPEGAQTRRFVEGRIPAAAGPPTAVVRAWAREQGWPVADRGRIRPEILTAYLAAHPHPD